MKLVNVRVWARRARGDAGWVKADGEYTSLNIDQVQTIDRWGDDRNAVSLASGDSLQVNDEDLQRMATA